jgi:hypothetical protein
MVYVDESVGFVKRRGGFVIEDVCQLVSLSNDKE